MPMIQLAETVSSTVGWSTQSLQSSAASHASRMQPVDVGSLSESSSSVANEPVVNLLAQPSELPLRSCLAFVTLCSSCVIAVCA